MSQFKRQTCLSMELHRTRVVPPWILLCGQYAYHCKTAKLQTSFSQFHDDPNHRLMHKQRRHTRRKWCQRRNHTRVRSTKQARRESRHQLPLCRMQLRMQVRCVRCHGSFGGARPKGFASCVHRHGGFSRQTCLSMELHRTRVVPPWILLCGQYAYHCKTAKLQTSFSQFHDDPNHRLMHKQRRHTRRKWCQRRNHTRVRSTKQARRESRHQLPLCRMQLRMQVRCVRCHGSFGGARPKGFASCVHRHGGFSRQTCLSMELSGMGRVHASRRS